MEKIKVLLVNDCVDDAQAILSFAHDQEVDFLHVQSPEEAIRTLADHDVGLALISLKSQRLRGVELAYRIRSVARHADLPILFISEDPDDHSVLEQSYKSGVVDILFKPFMPIMIKNKIRAFVELKKRNDLLKRSIYELIQLKSQAEETTRKRNEFLSNVSHEIRTPLSAVIGFSEIISNPTLSDSDRKRVRSAITTHGLQLMKLVDGILDFSKLEANQYELKTGRFSLLNLLKDIEVSLHQKAKDKHLNLLFSLKGIPEKLLLEGDSHCIRQVLINIIGNAIKFTDQGRVVVKASVTPLGSSEDQKYWKTVILVEDEGMGIEPDFVSSLFTPFVQSDSTTRKQFSGTGLGLAIAQRMMRLMGGDVRLVSSQETKGSIFEIAFQLKEAADASPRAKRKKVSPDAEFLAGKNILAVDDSPDNLELLQFVMSDSNVNLICVTSGEEAVNMAQKNQFDLILMDIQMPKMDGYETTQKIRNLGFDRPIVALTAHVVKHEIERCYQVGCNGVIGKPYSQKDLFRQISQHL